MPDTRSDAGVLLDIDGTLIDSTYHHAMAWHQAFTRHDVVVPVWRIHRAVGMGGDRLVAHVAGDDVEEQIGDEVRAAWRSVYAEMVDDVPALPGATDLVRRLVADGFAVALASSGDPEFSRQAMTSLGIEDDVSVLTTAEDADSSKPEPDILGVTLRKLDVGRAVVVGDTPYDVEAARKLGLECFAVLSGGFGRDELADAGAARVVAGLDELSELDRDTHFQAPRGV